PADPHAAGHGAGETPGILRIMERHRRIGEPERRPEVDIERIGIDLLAGVHPVSGVPDRLELTERKYELLAEHAGEELAALLAVAVLARDRAAVGHHQIGRLLHDGPVGAD